MSFYTIGQLVAVASNRIFQLLAGLLFIFSLTQAAHAARISITLNGIIDTQVAGSSEPYVGVGDTYSGGLQFDIDNTDQFTNISGDVTVGGVSTNFVGHLSPFSYVYGIAPPQIQIWFYVSPFGGGPGALNIETLALTVEISTNPFSTSLFEVFTAQDSIINTIGMVGFLREDTHIEHRYSNDTDPRSVIDQVSVIPLPAGLPLYAAGLALIGFIGWRRKCKSQ